MIFDNLLNSMAERPQQHEIGDEAEIQFQTALPRKWVYRTEAKDYGIDGSVEIFNEDGSHSGLRFYVQLKGTDAADLSTQTKALFKKASLDYWHSQNLPTLIVRYCSEEKKLYVAWHFDRRIKVSENGENSSIKFTEIDRWIDSSPNKIRLSIEKVKELKGPKFSEKLALRFAELDDSEIRHLQRRLRSSLQSYQNLISIGDRREEMLSLILSKEGEELIVSLEGISTASVQIEEDSEKLAANIVVAASFCLLAVGQIAMGTAFLESSHERADLHQQHDVSNIIAQRLTADENCQLLGEVAESLWSRGLDQFSAEMFIFFPLFEFENLHPSQIEISYHTMVSYLGHHVRSKSDQAGRVAYNIGEALLLKGSNRNAVHMFRKACELDADYAKRDYLYLSAGGAFFKEGRYKAASWCYLRSMRLSETKDPATMALFADAQLHRGRLGSALFWLEKALNYEELQEDPRGSKFALLHYAVNTLRDDGGKPRVTRQRLIAESMVQKEIKNRTSQIAEVVDKAINLDPISAYIWHAMGIERSNAGEEEGAIMPHLLAAVLSDNDPGYWLNFLLQGMQARVDQSDLMFWISAAYPVGYNHLAEAALERLNKVKNEQAMEFLERLNEVFSSMPVVERPKIMRAITGPATDVFSE